MYIQAIGTQRETGDGTQPSGIPLRVGVAIGAQFGTVGQRFACDAVKEAIAWGYGPSITAIVH